MPNIETRQEQGITRVLFNTGTLFHLYIGRWTGNKKMSEHDLLLEETVDRDVMYIGHKKLLPREAVEELQTIEGTARTFLGNRSVPFPIGNARYVAFHALRQVLAELQQLKQRWEMAVDNLVVGYPRFMETQLQALHQQAEKLAQKELAKAAPYAYEQRRRELSDWVQSQWQQNRALYPPVHELKSRFVFEWRMFKLSPLEGMEEMSPLSAEALAEEQARIRSDLNRWVSEVSVVMHQQLGQAARNARDLLEKNGKLNPKNLRPLFEAFETFSAVNFAGPSQFQSVIESIRHRYLQRTGGGETDWQLTAQQVNNSTDEMRTLLGSIADLAVTETAEHAGISTVRAGQFGRVIDL